MTDPTEINITAGTLKTSGSSYSVVDYSQRYVNVTITGGTFEGTTSAVFKGSNTSALEIDDCTVTTSGQIFNPASGKSHDKRRKLYDERKLRGGRIYARFYQRRKILLQQYGHKQRFLYI